MILLYDYGNDSRMYMIRISEKGYQCNKYYKNLKKINYWNENYEKFVNLKLSDNVTSNAMDIMICMINYDKTLQ